MKHMYAEIVYALTSPDGEVRYIGRTTHPKDRLQQHKYAKTPLGDWVREVGAMLVELEYCEYAKVHASKRERHWIEKHREEGSALFNVWPRQRSAIEAERAQ